jgi:CRISPR-associated protein Csd2
MNAQKLIVFKHDNALGRARSQDLFDLVGIKRVTDGEAPARQFSDYEVYIDKARLPKGVELIEML